VNNDPKVCFGFGVEVIFIEIADINQKCGEAATPTAGAG
jgi:hypothetical protein